MKKINIAIDGYSACGKSTLAKQLANKLGYPQFENRMGPAVMDDHYYLYKYAQIPAIDIIDFEYPNKDVNYWHTLQDIPQNCSAKSLEAVGSVITHFIYNQDGGTKE